MPVQIPLDKGDAEDTTVHWKEDLTDPVALNRLEVRHDVLINTNGRARFQLDGQTVTSKLQSVMVNHVFRNEFHTVLLTADCGVVVSSNLERSKLLALVSDVYETLLRPRLSRFRSRGVDQPRKRGNCEITDLADPLGCWPSEFRQSLLAAGLIVFEVATASSGGSAGKAGAATPHRHPTTAEDDPGDAPRQAGGGQFWASWCEPCREESPEVERFYRSLHGTAGLVGADYTDQTAAARKFIARYGLTYPMLSDPDGVFGARFGFSALPTTVILDPRGRIVETLRGPQTAADLKGGGEGRRLGVLPTDVVNAADRRPVSQRAVRATPVVVAKKGCHGLRPLG